MDESCLTVTAKDIVPNLDASRKKGDKGVIAVFGGHRGYIGATYFASIGVLRSGADMVYIFTSPEAEDVKILSPDFIVQPIINHDTFIEQLTYWLARADVVVIGPGFRREVNVYRLFLGVVNTCRTLKKGLVIDSSGLNLLAKDMDVIKDYPKPGVILTPNAEEFNFLFGEDYAKKIQHLGSGLTVLRKGPIDEGINSVKVVKFTGTGSNRRCMGQGDLLAGVVGTFLVYAIKHEAGKDVDPGDLALAACQGASKLVRQCNSRAYAKKGRAMVTSDMVEEIAEALRELFGQ